MRDTGNGRRRKTRLCMPSLSGFDEKRSLPCAADFFLHFLKTIVFCRKKRYNESSRITAFVLCGAKGRQAGKWVGHGLFGRTNGMGIGSPMTAQANAAAAETILSAAIRQHVTQRHAKKPDDESEPKERGFCVKHACGSRTNPPDSALRPHLRGQEYLCRASEAGARGGRFVLRQTDAHSVRTAARELA